MKFRLEVHMKDGSDQFLEGSQDWQLGEAEAFVRSWRYNPNRTFTLRSPLGVPFTGVFGDVISASLSVDES